MGINGLGDWFKKRLDDTQGVYHQANMFDGGRTFDTNRRGVAPSVAPAGVTNRNVFQKGFDQVNPFDSGRSWGAATPQVQTSVRDNLFQIKHNFVDPITTQASRGAFAVSQSPVGQFMGAPNFAQMNQRMSDQVRQTYGADAARAVDTRLNQNLLDRYGVNANDSNLRAATKVAGNIAGTAANVVPIASGAQILKAGWSQAPRLINNAGMAGAAANSLAAASQDNVTIKDVAKAGALGYGIGAAIPIAGAGGRVVVKGAPQAARVAIKAGSKFDEAAFTPRTTRLPLETTQALKDYSDRLVGAAPHIRGQAESDLVAKVWQIGDDMGIDLRNGTVKQKLDRIENILNNRAVNQGGYAKVPGGASDLPPAVKDLQKKLPKGYRVEADGAVFGPDGSELTTGQIQELTQAKHLTNFEQAARAGDEATMVKIAQANPTDNRVHIGATDQKMSRFANKTVQQSDEVSNPLKVMVKEQKVKYDPVTNKGRLEAADNFLSKKSNDAAYTHVAKTFEATNKVTDQDVVTAIQAAKRMDASGKQADLFRATEIYDTLSRHLTKKGQEIQAASLLNNRTPQGLLYTAQKILRKGKNGNSVELTPQIQKELKQLVDDVKAQKPGSYEDGLARYKVMEYVAKKVPASGLEKSVQMWKANLLSAPTTTGGNLTANTAEQIYKHGYKDPVAAGFDRLLSFFDGGKRSKSWTYRGLGAGATEGVGKGVKYFKTGYDPRNPLQKFDVRAIHYSDTTLGRAAEKWTQGIFKLMGAQDQPYYYASLRNSIADQAVTEAKNLGLKGTQRQTFIKQFISEPAQKVLELADKEARYDVFQNPTALGALASKVNKGAGGQFLIPFSQVPSSVATRMIDRTPLGLAKEVIQQFGVPMIKKGAGYNQRALANAMADASAGLVILGSGAALAKSGELTLGYPTNQKERDLWELEGKQPNSVKIGNTWISLNYLQPLGTLLAAGANYQAAKDEGKNAGDSFAAATAGAGKALTEQSFLKGVSGALNAVADPQRSAERFAEQTAGSVVPNIIRSAARSSDDVNRMQDGLGESVIAGIPGLRDKLPVRTDIFGEDVPRKTSAINSFLNPLRPSDVRPSTDLNSELRRLQDADEGITATKIIKDALGDGVELNRDQQLELKNAIGQQLKQAWAQNIKDGRYESLTDGDKRRVLEKIKDDLGAVVRAQYGYNKGLKVTDSSKLSTNQNLILSGAGNMVDYLGNAGDDTARANFESSNSKYQEIGERIYYKNVNGEVVSKPKALYEHEQAYSGVNLRLDRAKSADNYQEWVKLAKQKVELLEKKKAMYDPTFEADEINKLTIQQENIRDNINKYLSYGGFKKGRSGRGGRNGKGISFPGINVAVSQELSSPVVTNSSYRAPTLRLKNKGSVKVVSRNRGKVKLNAPKKLA